MNNIKQKVKEKIKQYSHDDYLDGYIKNEFLLKDGQAEIMLKVNNKKDLFDPRTTKNQLDLKESIYHFIDDKMSMLDNDISIILDIICADLDTKDKERIKHIINEHYAIELYKTQKEYKKHKLKILKLMASGVVFLGCYAAIAFNFSSKFLIEVFGFLFSFALWQAFETAIYSLSDAKTERESITQKLVMDIRFNLETDAGVAHDNII